MSEMTLHDAMREVLKRSGRPMTARELADEIQRRALFFRGDGDPPPPTQISARASRYPEIFGKGGDRPQKYWLL